MSILSKEEIARLQAGIEAGKINPHDAFKSEARAEATDRVYGFELDATIGLILAGVGASLNPLVGIGILVAAGGHIWNKIQNGDRVVEEIERGEFEKHLPRESRLAYQEILAAERKRLTGISDPKQLPSSTQNPAAVEAVENHTGQDLDSSPSTAEKQSPFCSAALPKADTSKTIDIESRDARKSSDPVAELKAIADRDQRLNAFLKRCAADGFPIGLLSQHPFIWCYGVSQSGKSTMAHMLSVIRILQGRKIGYYSIDNDYPRDVSWSEVVAGDARLYSGKVAAVAKTIGDADKGALPGVAYVFDEVYRAYTQKGISLQDLVAVVLQKGAKTRACVIGISQNDQLGANGLKDLDTAWKEERASVQAIAVKDPTTGQRQPTGRYVVTDEGKSSEWKLPTWLTPDSSDDSPVRIMLDIFSEAIAQSPVAVEAVETQQNQGFDSTLDSALDNPFDSLSREFEQTKRANQVALPEHLESILALAHRRQKPITARDVQRANLKPVQDANLSAEAIRMCFESLANQGYGRVEDQDTNMSFIVE